MALLVSPAVYPSLATCLVIRHIDIVVPPVFHMTGRYVVVDGLRYDIHRPNQYGLWVNDYRLIEVSDVYSTIKAGLTDTDGHTDIGCLCRRGDKDCHDNEQEMFHDELLFIGVSFFSLHLDND